VSQGSDFSTYLFNNFIILQHELTEKPHFLVINALRIPGQLFADNLTMASFPRYGLQKKTELVDKYCKNWNLNAI
jgi:hypothetical protein